MRSTAGGSSSRWPMAATTSDQARRRSETDRDREVVGCGRAGESVTTWRFYLRCRSGDSKVTVDKRIQRMNAAILIILRDPAGALFEDRNGKFSPRPARGFVRRKLLNGFCRAPRWDV